ncbi:MAG TPA: hypothetical protein VFF73_15005 [Planctomycetota bacterium]|nr:hypothetical protein [Planctomycetota bacterium]
MACRAELRRCPTLGCGTLMTRAPAVVALEDILVVTTYMIVATLGFLTVVLLLAFGAALLASHL